MAWVVDTCLLIDVAEGDPLFGAASAALIDSKRRQGITISPITYVELGPVFNGNQKLQNEFLEKIGLNWPGHWTAADTFAAHEAWQRYVTAKRVGTMVKRPIADVLIGSFASRFDGFLTRNEKDFHSLFPNLKILTP
jgi:predicted nucleic acid-binding protein